MRMKRFAGVALVVLAAAGAIWAQGTLQITGEGATFPYPIYSKWFDEYHKKFSNLEINYQSQGSGAGIKAVTDGTVDFSLPAVVTLAVARISAVSPEVISDAVGVQLNTALPY